MAWRTRPVQISMQSLTLVAFLKNQSPCIGFCVRLTFWWQKYVDYFTSHLWAQNYSADLKKVSIKCPKDENELKMQCMEIRNYFVQIITSSQFHGIFLYCFFFLVVSIHPIEINWIACAISYSIIILKWMPIVDTAWDVIFNQRWWLKVFWDCVPLLLCL